MTTSNESIAVILRRIPVLQPTVLQILCIRVTFSRRVTEI